MIVSFADRNLEKFYRNNDRRAARRYPSELRQRIIDKLFMLDHAQDINDLRAPPANRLEVLKGALSGFYSIRVNRQFRLVFHWKNGNVAELALTDYH